MKYKIAINKIDFSLNYNTNTVNENMFTVFISILFYVFSYLLFCYIGKILQEIENIRERNDIENRLQDNEIHLRDIQIQLEYIFETMNKKYANEQKKIKNYTNTITITKYNFNNFHVNQSIELNQMLKKNTDQTIDQIIDQTIDQTIDQIIDQTIDQHECPICIESKIIYVKLGCCHYFCGDCMAKYINLKWYTVENQTVKCPLCRSQIKNISYKNKKIVTDIKGFYSFQ
jgi:hypothetical protein